MSSQEDREQIEAQKLAARINRLFEVVHPADRDPYSPEEVATKLAETADEGPTISANYLRSLRRAASTNPTANSLRAIARFFKVEPGYLLNDDERTKQIEQELDKLQLLSDMKVQGIATRASRLTDTDRDWVLGMLASFEERRHGGTADHDDT